MPRGDLGEFFLQIANQQQRQMAQRDQAYQSMLHGQLYKAQTGALLQKMQDDKDTETAWAEAMQNGQDKERWELLEDAAKRTKNPRVSSVYMEKAGLEQNRWRDDLSKRVMKLVDDGYTDAANSIIANPKVKKVIGYPDDFKFLPGGMEAEGTVIASEQSPVWNPVAKRYENEGEWKVKQNKRGETVKAERITKGEMSDFQQASIDLRAQELERRKEEDRKKVDVDRKEEIKQKNELKKNQLKIMRDYNSEVRNLRNKYDASQRGGIPMTTEDWNEGLKDIYTRYEPLLEEHDMSWRGSKKQPKEESPAPTGMKSGSKEVNIMKSDGTKLPTSEIKGLYNKMQIDLGRVPSQSEFQKYVEDKGYKAEIK